MNRETFISFIADSSSAKKALVADGLISAPHKSKAVAYCESLSDEDLQSLATQLGYSENAGQKIEVANASNNSDDGTAISFLPSWKPYSTQVDTTTGVVDTLVIDGTFTGKRGTMRGANGSRRIKYSFQTADGTKLRVTSNELDTIFKDGNLNAGDVYQFKAVVSKVLAINGTTTTWLDGILLYAGNELLEDAMLAKDEREIELASLSAGAQKIINEQSDIAQAEAFLAKYYK